MYLLRNSKFPRVYWKSRWDTALILYRLNLFEVHALQRYDFQSEWFLISIFFTKSYGRYIRGTGSVLQLENAKVCAQCFNGWSLIYSFQDWLFFRCHSIILKYAKKGFKRCTQRKEIYLESLTWRCLKKIRALIFYDDNSTGVRYASITPTDFAQNCRFRLLNILFSVTISHIL